MKFRIDKHRIKGLDVYVCQGCNRRESWDLPLGGILEEIKPHIVMHLMQGDKMRGGIQYNEIFQTQNLATAKEQADVLQCE